MICIGDGGHFALPSPMLLFYYTSAVWANQTDTCCALHRFHQSDWPRKPYGQNRPHRGRLALRTTAPMQPLHCRRQAQNLYEFCNFPSEHYGLLNSCRLAVLYIKRIRQPMRCSANAKYGHVSSNTPTWQQTADTRQSNRLVRCHRWHCVDCRAANHVVALVY